MNSIGASIRIGKNGLSTGMTNEIKAQLEKKGIVKIKMLRSFAGERDKGNLAEEIAVGTKSVLHSRTGNILILTKNNIKNKNTN